ncbi:MAG: RimK/LysX family protein [Candidatus Saccharimonadales bacterium]
MAETHKQLTPIGTTEVIDLLDDGIFGVPAKVDTGADFSAIWASDIAVEGNTLRFRFFSVGSSYYQDKFVSSTSFKKVRVKNSFGDAEERYKIKLRIGIGKRKLTRWFSLADRSNSTYPVLLGKNFLKNTFVVDVSKRHVASEVLLPNKILIFGAFKSTNFFDKVENSTTSKVDLRYGLYGHLMFYMDGLNTSVVNLDDSESDLASYRLVYFKTHNLYIDRSAAVAEYLNFRGRRFFDKEVGNYTSTSKLTEYMKLNCSGIAVPASVCASNNYLRDNFDKLVELLGTPFVMKEVRSNLGKNNYLISTKSDFEKILSSALKTDLYMVQAYVPNDGFFRLDVFGQRVGLAVWRSRHVHKDALKAHLNKPKGGVNARIVEVKDVPEEAIELAIESADCMGRQVAGVDLVQDKNTKKWYVLEVNYAPELRGGSFVPEKVKAVAEWLDRELNR